MLKWRQHICELVWKRIEDEEDGNDDGIKRDMTVQRRLHNGAR